MTKLEELRTKMDDAGIDAVIVHDELNQRYLSNFAFTDGLLFISSTEAYLITDFRYFEMAKKQADKAFSVVMPSDRESFLSETLCSSRIKRVGFEGGSISYAVQKKYTERYPELDFADIGEMILQLRKIKSPEEISKIQKAQDITDKAFSHILSLLSPNMTELDVVAELEYSVRKLGGEGVAFDTIAVSGDASALPHGRARNVRLKPGFLTMDFGAKYDGYCSDMTRTVVIGKATEEMKSIYNTVLCAQREAIEFLRAGVDCCEADKIARDIIDKSYPDTFGHSLGHSLGLFIHETPALSKKYKGTKLRSGEVVTVEPGIYIYGKMGCRIEDMVKIEEHGVYNFTKSTKELIEIT